MSGTGDNDHPPQHSPTPEERAQFFAELDAQIALTQQDSATWAEELAERRLWEVTLLDGLEDDPWEGEAYNSADSLTE